MVCGEKIGGKRIAMHQTLYKYWKTCRVCGYEFAKQTPRRAEYCRNCKELQPVEVMECELEVEELDGAARGAWKRKRTRAHELLNREWHKRGFLFDEWIELENPWYAGFMEGWEPGAIKRKSKSSKPYPSNIHYSIVVRNYSESEYIRLIKFRGNSSSAFFSEAMMDNRFGIQFFDIRYRTKGNYRHNAKWKFVAKVPFFAKYDLEFYMMLHSHLRGIPQLCHAYIIATRIVHTPLLGGPIEILRYKMEWYPKPPLKINSPIPNPQLKYSGIGCRIEIIQ